MTDKKKIILALLATAAFFGAGFAIGYKTGPWNKATAEEGRSVRKGSADDLSHPLLECEVGDNPAQKREIAYFKGELDQLSRNLEARLGVSKVAVYFRDMKNGPWVGAKQDTALSPPKRYALPVVIACLKEGEKNPRYFDRKITYTGKEAGYGDHWPLPPAFRMTPGGYSVENLLERAVTFDDPVAETLLYQAVDKKVLETVFSDFGIKQPGAFKPEVAMTPEILSRFFRLLYNSSYLSKSMSERALGIMTGEVHKDGLAAGVPKGTTVSHDLSIDLLRDEADDRNDLWQVYDAGIVYYRGFPYSLSVVTLGADPRAEIRAIAEVSRFIYDKVDRHMKTAGGSI